MGKRTAADVSTWPVIWRVVAPGCGSYDHDMVFLQTENEKEARVCFHGLRRSDRPVRLERAQCGPLPFKAMEALGKTRSANPQNPETHLREIPAYRTPELTP